MPVNKFWVYLYTKKSLLVHFMTTSWRVQMGLYSVQFFLLSHVIFRREEKLNALNPLPYHGRNIALNGIQGRIVYSVIIYNLPVRCRDRTIRWLHPRQHIEHPCPMEYSCLAVGYHILKHLDWKLTRTFLTNSSNSISNPSFELNPYVH